MADINEFYLKDLAHKKDLLTASDGDLQVVDGLVNLRQALLHRLITIPGSLVHRPDYGVGIKLFQNSINNLQTRRRLANIIDEQFRRDFRVKKVTGVSVTAEDNAPETITVTVRIKAAGYDDLAMAFVPFGGS